MKKLILMVTCMLLLSVAQLSAQTFDQFTADFVKQYTAFNIPQLEMSYVEGIKKIAGMDKVKKELIFFNGVKKTLLKYKLEDLTPLQQQDHAQIAFETTQHLERLSLELQWLEMRNPSLATDGIYRLTNGKNWYRYILKKWLSASVTPEEIFAAGINEVERVKKKITDIRTRVGMDSATFYKHLNDPRFFISDAKQVQQAFEHTRDVIYNNLNKVFNQHSIPPLTIIRGENERLAQTPGYYDENTFYYNKGDQPYNKRQIDWLFIHEGVPGHHYQSSIYASHKNTNVQQLFYYLGLAEGWGAYTEELGKELGVYKTPYDELGKWQWDLVRSVRVPIDIGVNYLGWTDKQALEFWKLNIAGQDDIAMREIERVKRWPAQAITYKYGALQIMQWKTILQEKQGNKFDIKAFHDQVLNHGSLPIFMVRKNVLGN